MKKTVLLQLALLLAQLPLALFSQEKQTLESVLQKENVKILDIGNSYTENALKHIPHLIASAGIENKRHSLYMAVRAGATFKTWVDCYNNADNYTYYTARKEGNIISELGELANNVVRSSAYDGSNFRKLLTSTKWDIIIIHQASELSHNFHLWKLDGVTGYLNELYSLIEETNPQALIGMYIIHSYREGYKKGTTTYGPSLDRWQQYADAVKQMQREYEIDLIIPYGTAVQNLRASSLQDEYEFSHDGTHLANGIGEYVASCSYYETIFAPMYGISIMGNSYRNDSYDETQPGVVSITDKTAPLAQKAALLAAKDMFSVQNPEDDTSDIDNITTAPTHNDSNIYDIYGRIVTTPDNGIYIINGKKHYIRR